MSKIIFFAVDDEASPIFALGYVWKFE